MKVIALVLGLSVLILPSCITPSKTVMRHPAPEKTFMFVMHLFTTKVCEDVSCREAQGTFLGSGFSVAVDDNSTWGITAGHVCEPKEFADTSQLQVIHSGNPHTAEVVAIIKEIDICVFNVSGVRLPTVTPSSSELLPGEKVFALATPSGIYGPNLLPRFEGYYSGFTGEIPAPEGRGFNFKTLDAYTIPARPGSSGGPIFNGDGELVGMIIMARPEFQSFALSPRQAHLRAVIDAVIDQIK